MQLGLPPSGIHRAEAVNRLTQTQTTQTQTPRHRPPRPITHQTPHTHGTLTRADPGRDTYLLNCGESGHLSHTCTKPRNRGFNRPFRPKQTQKPRAEAVAVAMDTRSYQKGRAAKSQRRRRWILSRSMVKPHPVRPIGFSTRDSTVGSTRDMLTQQSSVEEPRTEKAMPK